MDYRLMTLVMFCFDNGILLWLCVSMSLFYDIHAETFCGWVGGICNLFGMVQ